MEVDTQSSNWRTDLDIVGNFTEIRAMYRVDVPQNLTVRDVNVKQVEIF